jgi:putative nucleotidyltransferase with HDIG domain
MIAPRNEQIDPGTQDRIKRNINRIQDLPALSNVVARIVSLADDPKVSGEQVAEIVGRDQAMVTAILKIVNSPFYGLNRRVSSINHAIVLLGYRTIRNIALSTTLANALPTRGDFDRRRFWTHAVCTAAASRLCARRLRDTDTEEAFLAGLIHDMGCVIFSHYFDEEFALALRLSKERSIPLPEAEAAVFGLDHTEAGALVARKWNFPPAVAEAIAAHHDAQKSLRTSQLAACVYLGNELTDFADAQSDPSNPPGPAGQSSLLERIDPEMRALFQLDSDSLAQLQADLDGEMEKARSFLDALNV